MLKRSLFSSRSAMGAAALARQQGVVLLVALIILVALTLAGVALLRSVDTANLVAGNMSFHESATQAGERSTEAAVSTWLGPKTTAKSPDLFSNSAVNGYLAMRQDPAAGQSWDAFWTATLAASSVTGATDAAGNTVSYVIQRLCDAAGAPFTINCSKPPTTNTGGSFSAGGIAPITSSQVYYRITTRIAGPRNTVSYTQTIVAL
jgi:type IV pilus assembly protein PilX